ncbi:hypothetical protein D3C86_2011650 [compost metagenome]
MRVGRLDFIEARERVEVAGQVPGDQPGRHPDLAPHQGHGRREVLAVSPLGLEEEVIELIRRRGEGRDLQVIRVGLL